MIVIAVGWADYVIKTVSKWAQTHPHQPTYSIIPIKNVKSQILAEKYVYFYFFYSYMSFSICISNSHEDQLEYLQTGKSENLCTNTRIDQQHQYRPVGCWPNYDDYLRNPTFLQISQFNAYAFVLQLVLVIRTKVKRGFEGVNSFSEKGEARWVFIFYLRCGGAYSQAHKV